MVLAHVVLYLGLRRSRTRMFGAINLVGIALLFGPGPAGLLAGIAALTWLLLWPIRRAAAAGHETAAHLGGWVSLLLLSLVFVSYKSFIDDAGPAWSLVVGTGPIEAVYDLLGVLSFSYVYLRTIDVVRSVTWGREPLVDPLALTGYLGPFHMLLSGPITTYRDHVAMDETPRPDPTFTHLVMCASTIVTGLFMKVVIAESMRLYRFGVEGPIEAGGWLEAAYVYVYLYFDFAGYSLVALGIGRLLHVPTPLNFDRPFLATTVTSFWSRWHMSLGTFVRNNIFLPSQLALARRVRRRSLATAVSLLPMTIAFVQVAMWHRITTRFFLWGAGMAAVMVGEKLVRERIVTSRLGQRRDAQLAWRWIGPVYTQAIIVTGFYYVLPEIFAS